MSIEFVETKEMFNINSTAHINNIKTNMYVHFPRQRE